jgi:hypothetical protein
LTADDLALALAILDLMAKRDYEKRPNRRRL